MSAPCPVYGFVIHLRPSADTDLDAVLESLRRELLSARGLMGAEADEGEIVVAGDGFQATHADREATLGWLAARLDAEQFTVGPLSDVGHAA
jgi:hypothetical protein